MIERDDSEKKFCETNPVVMVKMENNSKFQRKFAIF